MQSGESGRGARAGDAGERSFFLWVAAKIIVRDMAFLP